MSRQGTVKLCDFGSAKNMSPLSPLTNLIIINHRPIEILFGCDSYSFEVDMWGVGCRMGELLTGMPLFTG